MTTKNKTEESNNEVHVFKNEVVKMSAFQPIDIKTRFGQNYVLNGDNNINFKTYKDAYDDSPTNSSIINSFVNYIYGIWSWRNRYFNYTIIF